MNIRLYHARILTMQETLVRRDTPVDNEPLSIQWGSIWIQKDKIIYIGDEQNLEDFYQKNPGFIIHWDREIDCEGNLLMPGFKNMHTHSPMTAMRSLADDMPLELWLHNKIFPFEAKFREEDMILFTKLAIMEYLESGITEIFDMYFCKDAVAAACREFHYPVTLCGAVNDFVQSAKEMEELYHHYNQQDDYVSYRLGFHAPYTTSDKLTDEIAELAKSLKAPVYAHIAETEKEVRNCMNQYGLSPIQYLNQKGMFEYGGGGFHMVYTDEKDRSIMKEHNLTVVTNPSSNIKLASGIAPIAQYHRDGINVCIGTDGASSNNSLNMFKEMFLTACLSKVSEHDAQSLPAPEVLQMATINGSIMMGNERNRCLAENMSADLIMIDTHHPNMQPENNLISHLVYSAGKENVKMTMIRGEILYENGKFSKVPDPEELYIKCNERVKTLTS